ncbi:MAG: stage II sporulation protein M, partial [Pseudomonadota bacterium]
WSRAVREIGFDVAIALAICIAGAVVGWLLVDQDQEWFYRLAPVSLGDPRAPGASREALLETIAVEDDAGGLSSFAAFLFSNNAGVSILAFALGFAFGLPSLMLLVHNFASFSAMMWVFHSQGLHWEFAAWLSVHGTTELFAIVLSGAAGLHIGRSMAFPGSQTVLEAASTAGKRGAVVMVGVVLMMVIAALLEAFPRQLVEGTSNRFMIGGMMLTFWLAYFFLYRPRRVDEAAI